MKVVIDDCRLERMDVYTDPLNDKIKRQAAEITRLLKDNAELKKGREEAWKLAQKIIAIHGYSLEEIEGIFGTRNARECLLNYTYSEAAAKVAEWERKNEICVGDVVTFHGNCGLVTFIGQNIKGISKSGLAFITCKEECTKTGKHIDVDAWLAQIGGGSDETEN